jgi:hypothetical protein
MSETKQRRKHDGAGAEPVEFCRVSPIHKQPHD